MKTITITEEMHIPGTDIVLEKGDKIRVLSESTLPAIAQATGLSNADPRILNVTRQDTVYDTCIAMGLPTKINKMNNVVASVSNMQDAGAVLSTIYQQFGVKGSFVVTWTGEGKVYFDPKTPVDSKVAIAYANNNGLSIPDKRRYLIG